MIVYGILPDAMSSKKSRSDMISSEVNQYLLQRGITQGRDEVYSLSDSVVDPEPDSDPKG